MNERSSRRWSATWANNEKLQVGIEELEYYVLDPGEDISVTERLLQSKEGEARKQGPGKKR